MDPKDVRDPAKESGSLGKGLDSIDSLRNSVSFCESSTRMPRCFSTKESRPSVGWLVSFAGSPASLAK